MGVAEFDIGAFRYPGKGPPPPPPPPPTGKVSTVVVELMVAISI